MQWNARMSKVDTNRGLKTIRLGITFNQALQLLYEKVILNFDISAVCIDIRFDNFNFAVDFKI